MQEYNSPWVLRQLLNEYVDGAAQHQRKGIVDGTALPATAHEPRMILWQGDITRLNADAIVNAANSQMLRCFVP